jgi:hypothetical protein
MNTEYNLHFLFKIRISVIPPSTFVGPKESLTLKFFSKSLIYSRNNVNKLPKYVDKLGSINYILKCHIWGNVVLKLQSTNFYFQLTIILLRIKIQHIYCLICPTCYVFQIIFSIFTVLRIVTKGILFGPILI